MNHRLPLFTTQNIGGHALILFFRILLLMTYLMTHQKVQGHPTQMSNLKLTKFLTKLPLIWFVDKSKNICPINICQQINIFSVNSGMSTFLSTKFLINFWESIFRPIDCPKIQFSEISRFCQHFHFESLSTFFVNKNNKFF